MAKRAAPTPAQPTAERPALAGADRCGGAGNGAAGPDLQLVLAIGSLWGEEARRRLRFVEVAAPESSSRLGALLGLRR